MPTRRTVRTVREWSNPSNRTSSSTSQPLILPPLTQATGRSAPSLTPSTTSISSLLHPASHHRSNYPSIHLSIPPSILIFSILRSLDSHNRIGWCGFGVDQGRDHRVVDTGHSTLIARRSRRKKKERKESKNNHPGTRGSQRILISSLLPVLQVTIADVGAGESIIDYLFSSSSLRLIPPSLAA